MTVPASIEGTDHRGKGFYALGIGLGYVTPEIAIDLQEAIVSMPSVSGWGR